MRESACWLARACVRVRVRARRREERERLYARRGGGAGGVGATHIARSQKKIGGSG